MNLVKVRGVLTCLLFVLAGAANAQVERYVEGVHYTRLPESAAFASNADENRQSILEIFWYGCGHCYAFDPLLNHWVEEQADTVQFARSPMIWDANTEQHARLFHTARALGLQEQMHERIFDEIHQRRNYLLDEKSVGALFAEFGVDADAFSKAYKSFGVDAELRKTETRQREVFIPGVPALIVNGSFLINTTKAVPTHAAMLEVAEFLLDKKS